MSWLLPRQAVARQEPLPCQSCSWFTRLLQQGSTKRLPHHSLSKHLSAASPSAGATVMSPLSGERLDEKLISPDMQGHTAFYTSPLSPQYQ